MSEHRKHKDPKTEKVPMLLIYKENQQIKTDISDDVNNFELYGFLKLFIKKIGIELFETIKDRTDKETLI